MSNASNTVRSINTRRRRGRPAADAGGDVLRDDILSAAASVYCEVGYQNCTVARLTEAANVSRPTFYRLFADRQQVITAIVESANVDLRQRIQSAVAASEGLRGAVHAAIAAYFGWCEATGPLAGRIYSEIGDSESPASSYRERMLAELAVFLEGELQPKSETPVPTLFYDTLIRVVENCGIASVWPRVLPTAEIEANKSMAIRMVDAVIANEARYLAKN